MSHTQGKLELEEVINDSGQIKHLCPIGNDGFSILTVVEHEGVKFAAVYKDADARRLVACWNAFEGCPTELLELHGSQVVMPDLPYSELKAQRDELLKALEQTWEVLDAAGLMNLSNGVQLGQTVWYVKAFDAKNASDAAIANTKGKP